MRIIFPRLLLFFSIVFAPFGQSIAMDMCDTTEGCTECSNHMDENKSCVNNACFHGECVHSFSASAFPILNPSKSFDFDNLTFGFRDHYDPHFISQTPPPLYRPPIT